MLRRFFFFLSPSACRERNLRPWIFVLLFLLLFWRKIMGGCTKLIKIVVLFTLPRVHAALNGAKNEVQSSVKFCTRIMIHSLHMLDECDTRNKNLYICQHKKRAKNENEKETMREKGKKNEKKNSAPCEDRTHDLQMSAVWLWDWRAAYCANEALPGKLVSKRTK